MCNTNSIFLFLLFLASTLFASSQTNITFRKQRLDSIITRECGELKTILSFDEDENMIGITNYELVNNCWKPVSQVEKFYNAKSLCHQSKNYYWENGFRILSSQDDFFYNSLADTTKIISHRWDSLGNLKSYWKLERFYNDRGAISKIVSSEGKPDGYLNDSKEEYIYNSSNNLKSLDFYEWKGNEWIIQRSKRTTYNKDGNIESIVEYESDNPFDKTLYKYGNNGYEIFHYRNKNDSWILDQKHEVTNTNHNQILSNVSSYLKDNQWIKNEKLTYNYYKNGNIQTQTKFIHQDGKWIIEEEHNYDTDGNLIETFNNYHNGIPMEKIKFDFDNNIRLSDVISNLRHKEEEHFWFCGDAGYSYLYCFVKKPIAIEFYKWDSSNNLWRQSNKTSFFYSDTN